MNTLDGKREQRRQNFIENIATKNHMKEFSFATKEQEERDKLKLEKLMEK